MQTVNYARRTPCLIQPSIYQLTTTLCLVSIFVSVQSFVNFGTSTISGSIRRQQNHFDRKLPCSYSFSPCNTLDNEPLLTPKQRNSFRREDWINRSVQYYTQVRRMDIDTKKTIEEDSKLIRISSEHYFALLKIRNGKPNHAEQIYGRMINEIMKKRHNSGDCDHAALAVSTLLLALLKQRQGDLKGTRDVFIKFFRIVGEDCVYNCSCSAKVLQAFALFEMKNGNSMKSFTLAERAVQMDPSLKGILQWKQFQEVAKRRLKLRKSPLH